MGQALTLRADQLAELVLSLIEGLRQGLPDDWSIRPLSLSAGVGLSEGGKVEGNLHIPRSMGAHIS
jgi:hypothetical protein